MERTAPSTARSSTQEVISQNLTVEQLRNKRMAANSTFNCKVIYTRGKGAFGEVYIAHLQKTTQENIAMKIIRREDGDQIQEADQYNLIEIEIMSQIDNPHINKLIDYYFQEVDGKEELVLLQPLATIFQKKQNQRFKCAISTNSQKVKHHCNLTSLENYPEGQMPEKQVIEYLAQLAIGTKAMHDKNVIHRDLNPWNILVFKNDKQKTTLNDQEYILKISDFGCSRILEPHEYKALSAVGKISFMAPEQHNNSKQGYNESVDIYALGLTIFKMITGKILHA
eukprot:403346985